MNLTATASVTSEFQFQESAARGHMDFLPQVIPDPIQDDLRSQENLSRELEMAASRVFKPTLPPLHWGINE